MTHHALDAIDTYTQFRVFAPRHAQPDIVTQLQERLHAILSAIPASHELSDPESGAIGECVTISIIGEIHIGVWQGENALTVAIGGATRWASPITRSHLAHWMEDPESCQPDIAVRTGNPDPIAAVEHHEALIQQLTRYLMSGIAATGGDIDRVGGHTERMPPPVAVSSQDDAAMRDALVAAIMDLYPAMEPRATPFIR